MMPRIDLNNNTIDGRRHWPRIVEFAYILSQGEQGNEKVIRRLYGLSEPDDARNAVKQLAFRARQAGVPIYGRSRHHDGYYRLGR